jgi:outer membrane protein
MMVRSTNIAFDTDDQTVATLVPLILFENRYVFFRPLEGGLHLFNRPGWELNLISRVHFFDIPFDYQNEVQGDNLDTGVQLLWKLRDSWSLGFDASTDFGGRASANVVAAYDHWTKRSQLRADVRAKFKGSDYNSTYWGLEEVEVDGGVELGVGVLAYYDVWSSLYAMGGARLTLLDKPARDVDFVIDDAKWEAYLGIGLSDPMDEPRKARLPENGYVRVGHMWATPSALNQIIRGNASKDPDNHQLTTIFYGHPLTDRLFGLPIEFFLHPGVGLHWKSAKQDYELELILSIKFYYTIPLPVRIRLGAAEGVSWVTDVPYREEQNLAPKGYTTSQYLNYLDFSVDLNLGDITPGESLDKLWLGYYIHHRSAIFKSAQQFGRIEGGSNFQAVYLQYHF